jgi:hypothetical protein
MEAEVAYFCFSAGLLKGIVHGGFSDGISPRPHEETLPVTVLFQPRHSFLGGFIDGDCLGVSEFWSV